MRHWEESKQKYLTTKNIRVIIKERLRPLFCFVEEDEMSYLAAFALGCTLTYLMTVLSSSFNASRILEESCLTFAFLIIAGYETNAEQVELIIANNKMDKKEADRFRKESNRSFEEYVDKKIDIIFKIEKLISCENIKLFIPNKETASKIGIEIKKDNFEASYLSNFKILATEIAIPDLLTPGTRDSIWKKPINKTDFKLK